MTDTASGDDKTGEAGLESTAGNASQPTAPGKPKRRRWGLIIGLIVVAGLLIFGTLVALVVPHAMAVKTNLEETQTHLKELRAAFGQPDQDLVKIADSAQQSADQAVAETDNFAWSALEWVPVVGANLTAVRETAESVDIVVQDAVVPLATAANGLSVESLKPENGRVKIAKFKKLAPAVVQANTGIQAANAKLQGLNKTFLLGPVKSGVAELQAQLSQLAPATQQASDFLPLLYPMLGGDGPRNYLLMFQNNAEERASGGNPASMAILTIDNGKVTLGRQAGSLDFPRPYPKPPYTPHGTGNADWESVYGERASTRVTNITMTPDFPSTAKMAKAMWEKTIGGKVDGVISVDPVALSYLLKATGPIKLADGSTITSDNAVAMLLNEVYIKYPEMRVQDAVFAAAAQTVFAALTNGSGDAKAYLKPVQRAIAEQRIKVWSAHGGEQEKIVRTPVGNMLPADNSKVTALGVYNNDDSQAKMSYYLDDKIKVVVGQCKVPTYAVSAAVTNNLSAAKAKQLPEFILASKKHIPFGGDRQWVQIYGPVGGKLESMTVDGKPVKFGTSLDSAANTNKDATGAKIQRPAVQGNMYGRPVGVVAITLGPKASKTVEAKFTGSADDSPTVVVSHTPRVRPVPVTIKKSACS